MTIDWNKAAQAYYAPPQNMCRFYLGTHMPTWLRDTHVPLFVSRRRLQAKKMHRAVTTWALDSGGFTELNMFGKWETTPELYASEVQRYTDEIGGLRWAAIQDWMCEPKVLEKTGLSVKQHQERTIDSYFRLMALAPHLPWIPTLQGFTTREYLRHIDDWTRSGVDLQAANTVGVGSVCRRQGSDEIASLFQTLHAQGLRNMHGFGVKTQGLRKAAQYLQSADSLAWSFTARREVPLPGCAHDNCANCKVFALKWRDNILTIPGVH